MQEVLNSRNFYSIDDWIVKWQALVKEYLWAWVKKFLTLSAVKLQFFCNHTRKYFFTAFRDVKLLFYMIFTTLSSLTAVCIITVSCNLTSQILQCGRARVELAQPKMWILLWGISSVAKWSKALERLYHLPWWARNVGSNPRRDVFHACTVCTVQWEDVNSELPSSSKN